MGKPVALEASADERDTRGFISMTIMRPVCGLTANCTLEPPVSTPISRNTAIDALRMIWYSLSVRVCAGATVMESPVCTPMGSRFSIEQMIMQLSRSEEHTSELQSLMRISYAVFCLKKKRKLPASASRQNRKNDQTSEHQTI